jgi:hypothetical protein
MQEAEGEKELFVVGDWQKLRTGPNECDRG